MTKLILKTIGQDVEGFLRDEQGNLHSSIGLIPGDKKEVHHIDEGICILKDNILFEMTIPASSTKEEWIENNEKAEVYIRRFITHETGLIPCYEASATIPEDSPILLEEGALEFGCTPSWSAYTEQESQPSAEDAGLFRSAGGHIHLGIEGLKSPADYNLFVRCLDLFLAVPAVVLDPDRERTKAGYGTPGEYRVKPYGLEYRTLSNFWFNLPQQSGWVWDQVQKAIEFYSSPLCMDTLGEPYYLDCMLIQEAITDKNTDLAKFLSKKFKEALEAAQAIK